MDLVVLDNPKEAEEFHYDGVKRLLKIQLKDKFKNLLKNPPRFESIGLPLQSHINPDLLRANFVDIIMDEMMEFPLESPRTKNEFDLLVLNSKKIIPGLTEQLSLGLVGIAEGYNLLVKTMNQFKGLPNDLLRDCNDQIDALLPPFEKPLFLFKHIEHIPRYIKAIIARLDKYPQRRIKDDELIKDIIRLKDKWIEKVVEMVEKNKSIPMEFIEFQWSLQELRVSLFAQELKTPYPISVKRMDLQWQTLVDLK